MDMDCNVRLHTRQDHGLTIRQTDATPAEGVDRVNILAEDVLETRVCTHNQGGGQSDR